MTNVNNGHRQRMRERMKNEGLKGFQDHELVEMLLYQSIPRKDTNKIAHKLLNSFGNLYNLLNADVESLEKIEGVSQATACNIALQKELWRRYKMQEKNKVPLNKVGSIMQYARQLIAEIYTERMVVVYVDRNTHFMFSDEFLGDEKYSVRFDIKKVVATAVRLGASGILLFHCHLGDDCNPSDDDIVSTGKLIYALSGLEIVLLEHMIFNAAGNYYSFFREGQLDEMAKEYNEKIQGTKR